MKTQCVASLILGVVLAHATAAAQGTNGSGNGGTQRGQDQLQTSSPKLEQPRSRMQGSLPGTVQQAVQDMKQARERYQQQLQAKKKELAGSTSEERERLREQLRGLMKEQARDREQLRERLQALRESLPTHDQLLEQAREQIRDRERRGD